MYFKARNFSETNFRELKETQNIKELTSAFASLVFFSDKKLSQMDKYIKHKRMFEKMSNYLN